MGIKFIGEVPSIRVAPVAFAKMQELIRQAEMEVGWLGEVSFDPLLNVYMVLDIHIFKQEVHSTTCEIDESDLSDFGNELLKAPDGVEKWNRIKMWGHSHVEMSTSPSSQDESQMEEFVENPFFIRVIGNKKGEYRYDLYEYDRGILFEDTPWELDMSTYDMQDFIKKEMKKVTVMKSRAYTKTWGGYSGAHQSYVYDEYDWNRGKGYTQNSLIPFNKDDKEEKNPLVCLTSHSFESLIAKCSDMQSIYDVCEVNEDGYWWQHGSIIHEPRDIWEYYGEMYGFEEEELCQVETKQDLMMLTGLVDTLNDWEETLLWQVFKSMFEKEEDK